MMLLLRLLNLGRRLDHDLCFHCQGRTHKAALPVDVLDAHLRIVMMSKLYIKVVLMPLTKYSTHSASTRLLLEVLLEAGLVGELPEAVGALERHALGAAPSAAAGPYAPRPARTSGVRSLHVVVQEALLREILRGNRI